MSHLVEPLLHNTFTTDDLHRRIGLWRSVWERTLFQDDVDESQYQQLLRTSDALPEDIEAVDAWGTAWCAAYTDHFSQRVQQLEHAIDQLPTVRIFVPVLFDTAAKELLGTWYRENIEDTALLELVVDPATVGGCGIVVRDRYHDLSLSARLDKSHEQLAEIMNAYEN